ncbi:MAG: hypothetical protein ACQESR_26665 [Planctomycetota bacterium]
MMILPVQLSIDTACLVTGQVKDRVQAIERTFQEGGASDVSMGQVAVWCVLATSLIFLLWRMGRRLANEDRGGYHSTSRLFGELCRLHCLDWPSRRLLKKLARARQLEPPTRLFIESSWFDEPDLPVSLHPFRARLAEIKRQLFGTDESHVAASKRDSAPAPTHPCASPRD